MGEVVSLLDRPVYTFREVDRLLGLNQDTTRRWVDGYRRAEKRYAPIVREESTGDAVEQFIKERPEGPWWHSLTKNARHEYSYKPS